MCSICILLSTYNGDRFLRQQLDSLVKQKFVDMKILVRDDGSTDGTIEILEEFKKNNPNMFYYIGKNIGVNKSFLDLMINADDADYYAFCDQDDVWDNDKLYCAIKKMKDLSINKPNLYYSNLRVVDEDLNFLRNSHLDKHYQDNIYSALVEPMATGCTVVFNKCALEYVKNHVPKYYSSHDAWMYMLCKLLGNVIYDFYPHISYRQHGGNVVGTYMKRATIKDYFCRIAKRIDKNKHVRYKNVCEFKNLYASIINGDAAKKINKIVKYNSSFMNRMHLLLDPSIHTTNWRRELLYRFLIVVGRL